MYDTIHGNGVGSFMFIVQIKSFMLFTCQSMQTSNTALFLLFEMAKHPEIQERMLEEIRSVMGDRKQPTWEDIQKMKLVRNAIKETMRLYLPVGALPRLISEDAVLNGYHVPAGVRKGGEGGRERTKSWYLYSSFKREVSYKNERENPTQVALNNYACVSNR